MITTLDTQSWAKELFTGNAAYIQTSAGVLFIVSNVRADNTFAVFKSGAVPPAPGPGATFTTVAHFSFGGTTDIDFDPAVAYDPGTQLLHIIGTRTNASDANLADVVKFTYDTTLGGNTLLTVVRVLATGLRVRDAYDIVTLSAGHTEVAISVDEGIAYDPAGLNVTPTIGMNIVVMELDGADAVVSGTIHELQNSPPRTGDTFSSVSLISQDGANIELYFESHPKLVTFQDQLFKIRQFNRSSGGVWGTSVELNEFQGRYTDDRLTVVPSGDKRLLAQVYFNQLQHPQGLVGNLILGFLGLTAWSNVTSYSSGNKVSRLGLQYVALSANTGFDPATDGGVHWSPINGWTFTTEFGSVVGGSIVQATPSIDIAGAMNVAFLLEPFNSPAQAWPLHVATVDVNLVFVDVPGFYNQQNFTWLRGTKSLVDNVSLWSIIGERVQGLSPSPLPVYMSFFNVPPIATMLPTSATVYRGAAGYDAGSGFVSGDLPLHVTSADADQDALLYIWSENDPDLLNVKLTTNGPDAILDVARAVGGAARAFTVGVAVIDLFPDLVTPRHPSLDITNIQITSNILTVDALNGYVASETALLYGIALAPPAAPTLSQVASGVPVANITHINITGDLLTITANNTFSASDKVVFAALGVATYLNGQVVTLLSATPTDFTATFVHADDDQNDTGTATSPVARTYKFKVTYLNAVGETTGSVESTIALTDGNVAMVTSPAASGDAVSYNVYATAGATNTETLQNLTPITLGTDWTEPDTLLITGVPVPIVNKAYLEFVNDAVVTVATASPTQFTVNPFTHADFPSTPVVGFASTQFQFATCAITVPVNNPPVITPQPQFADATITNVTILTNVLTIAAVNGFLAGQKVTLSGLTTATFLEGVEVTILALGLSGAQFEANFTHADYASAPDTGTAKPQTARGSHFTFAPVITGATDIDDITTYTWVQTAGTAMIPTNGASGPTLSFDVLGTDVHGEDLVFSLTVNDGVNSPVTTTGFTVHVQPYDFTGLDSLFLSRAIWNEQTNVTFVYLDTNVLTIVAVNGFAPGQPITFSGLGNATFLNTKTVSVISALNTPLASSITNVARTGTLVTINALNNFTSGKVVTVAATTTVAVNGTFILVSASSTQFTYNTAASGTIASVADTGTANEPSQFTAAFTRTNYTLTAEITGTATTAARISQRNTPLTWGPLMTSAMLTNLETVKRVSVLDGSDRYVIISKFSVLVFGGVTPILYLLRRLLTPQKTRIVDAVHTEQDYSLVLDDLSKLFRYSDAPLINTDNPDTTLDLGTLSPFRFNRMFITPAFADQRVLVCSGPDGILLVQLRSSTLQVLASLELSTLNGFIYGSDNVQFVRTNGVESLREGKILIGSVQPNMATITKLRILNNNILVTADNNFKVGDKITFTGVTNLTFLNDNAIIGGREFVVIAATATTFQCALQHADAGTGPNYTDTGTATSSNSGTTYETLVSLANGQIIGTWDASKLRNQFVESGEILFEPESTYTGRPPAPVQAVPSALNQDVTIAWIEERPDLVFAYDVEFSTDNGVSFNLLQHVNSGAILKITATLPPGQTYKFRIRAFSLDGPSSYSNIQSITI